MSPSNRSSSSLARPGLPKDLACLGAALLPTAALVRALARRPVADDVVQAAVAALALWGPARDAALRDHPLGAPLLAALELARRAERGPPPFARRVHTPLDVAQLLSPYVSGAAAYAVALDARLTVARLVVMESTAAALGATLAAGCTRVVTAATVTGPAVPTPAVVDAASAFGRAAATVGVVFVDHVLLGDDGHASLGRLGLLPTADRRYR